MPAVHPKRGKPVVLPTFDVEQTESDHQERRYQEGRTTEYGYQSGYWIDASDAAEYRLSDPESGGTYMMRVRIIWETDNKRTKPRIYTDMSADVQAGFMTVKSPEVADFPHLDLRNRYKQEDGTWGEVRDEPSIYTHRGDYPEVDAAFDALNGNHVAMEKAFINLALNTFDKAPKGAATAKLTFSNYCGCSCPCSPGFILDLPTSKRTRVKGAYSWQNQTTVEVIPGRRLFSMHLSVISTDELVRLEEERKEADKKAKQEKAKKAAAKVREAQKALRKAEKELAGA